MFHKKVHPSLMFLVILNVIPNWSAKWVWWSGIYIYTIYIYNIYIYYIYTDIIYL
jgi:hypothetical protein